MRIVQTIIAASLILSCGGGSSSQKRRDEAVRYGNRLGNRSQRNDSLKISQDAKRGVFITQRTGRVELWTVGEQLKSKALDVRGVDTGMSPNGEWVVYGSARGIEIEPFSSSTPSVVWEGAQPSSIATHTSHMMVSMIKDRELRVGILSYNESGVVSSQVWNEPKLRRIIQLGQSSAIGILGNDLVRVNFDQNLNFVSTTTIQSKIETAGSDGTQFLTRAEESSTVAVLGDTGAADVTAKRTTYFYTSSPQPESTQSFYPRAYFVSPIGRIVLEQSLIRCKAQGDRYVPTLLFNGAQLSRYHFTKGSDLQMSSDFCALPQGHSFLPTIDDLQFVGDQGAWVGMMLTGAQIFRYDGATWSEVK